MTDTNPALITFLIGKFQRASIRETLEGMTISDISGVYMPDFIACLNQKDRLIGARLWLDVLQPMRDAWQEWKALEPEYTAAKKRFNSLVLTTRTNLMPPNIPVIGGQQN